MQFRKAVFRTSTITVRANTTAYALGDQVQLGTSDLNVYEVITAGTTAGSPPSFNLNLGDTTVDGTVTWLTLNFLTSSLSAPCASTLRSRSRCLMR